jgi:Lamin Tail Domain
MKFTFVKTFKINFFFNLSRCMKKVILFLLFIPTSLFCQVSDNFETGNLKKWTESVNGHWKADSIGPITGKYSLHHVYDNPSAGIDQIGIPVTNLEPSMGPTKWSFKIKHGYDPSSSNNWGVFLISDNEPPSMIPGSKVNGFVIGVNLTGNDDTLRLWKLKNGTLSTVLNTGINWERNIGSKYPATVSVERSQTGIWKTVVFSSGGALINTASCTDIELFKAEWFGIYYKYTSSCDRLLWVDDISIDGVFYEDKMPPEIIKCINDTYYSIELTLNEEPSTGFFLATNFSLNGTTETSNDVTKISPLSVRLTFEKHFINKTENHIVINSLCDEAGNCKSNVSVSFTPVWAEAGDVVISEIMADPVPSVSLPEREYLEILNKTNFQFNLKNWKLISETSNAIFPETILEPGELLIISQMQDTSLFKKYGRVTGVKSFPALIDAGRLIVLSDSSGNLIHGVDYSSNWYGDDLKKNGGWSLEIIDPEFPFFSDGNWTASVSKLGGTPGSRNSVNGSNPDLFFKGIINAFPGDSSYLEVSFSEPVKNLAESASGIRINGSGIQSVLVNDQLMREFIIKPDNLFIRHKQYSLAIPGTVTDFAGNYPEVSSFTFGIPEKVAKSDMVFNEIMFNPLPGDADYIELYNSSEKVINASELLIVSVNEFGNYSSPISLSGYNRVILPGSYYVITTDRKSLLDRYFSANEKNIFQVSQLPSMPDDKGHLALFNRELELIDEVSYNEKMHYSLLSGYEGISLEKIRPSALSSDPENWHSASEASGWGTPGTQNSVFSAKPVTDDRIVFSSTRVTPDNDGHEDLLVIDLNLKGIGNIVSVTVYNETGIFIRKLANNLLAGSTATITWDGTASDGSLVNSGIYIILISVYDDTGKTVKWKKVCAVIR